MSQHFSSFLQSSSTSTSRSKEHDTDDECDYHNNNNNNNDDDEEDECNNSGSCDDEEEEEAEEDEESRFLLLVNTSTHSETSVTSRGKRGGRVAGAGLEGVDMNMTQQPSTLLPITTSSTTRPLLLQQQQQQQQGTAAAGGKSKKQQKQTIPHPKRRIPLPTAVLMSSHGSNKNSNRRKRRQQCQRRTVSSCLFWFKCIVTVLAVSSLVSFLRPEWVGKQFPLLSTFPTLSLPSDSSGGSSLLDFSSSSSSYSNRADNKKRTKQQQQQKSAAVRPFQPLLASVKTLPVWKRPPPILTDKPSKPKTTTAGLLFPRFFSRFRGQHAQQQVELSPTGWNLPPEDIAVFRGPAPMWEGSFRYVDDDSTNNNNEQTTVCPADNPHVACVVHFPLVQPKVSPAPPGEIAGDESSSAAVAAAAASSSMCTSSDYCLMTRQGQKDNMMPTFVFGEMPNQDRAALFHIFPQKLATPSSSNKESDSTRKSSDNNNHSPNPQMFVFLADGHGELGHFSAATALQDLPFRLFQTLPLATSTSSKEESAVQPLFSKAFLEADANGYMERIPHAGTTAAVIWQNGPVLHLASAGDSHAMVVQYTITTSSSSSSSSAATQILARAVRHKPGDPAERARIEAAGGTVMIPSPDEVAQGGSSRVFLVDGKSEPLALAMSRCLGDYEGKQTHVLTAEPDVVTVDLRDYQPVDEVDDDDTIPGSRDGIAPGGGGAAARVGIGGGGDNGSAAKVTTETHFFVVAMTDGVIDFLPLDQVLERIGNALYAKNVNHPNGTNRDSALGETCRDILNKSAQEWAGMSAGTYRDDMTIVVSKILF